MSKSESSDNSRVRSKGSLGVALSSLKGFSEPKVRVEQYSTDSEIAAEVLWTAYLGGDIGKVSVDLGCGTGIMGVGLLLLGAKKVYFVDSDEKVIEIAKTNLKKVKSEFSTVGEAIFKCVDVLDFDQKADLVVQNPPFGVKVRHMDRIFLEKAFETSDVIYSFHKSEGKKFILDLSTRKGFNVTNIWDFDFPLKNTYGYHTRKIKRIKVSCFRFEKQKIYK
jgi:putative methylase